MYCKIVAFIYSFWISLHHPCIIILVLKNLPWRSVLFYTFGLLLQVLTYMMTVESGHVQQTACRSWFRSQTPQSWRSVNSRVIHPIQSSLVCINIHQELNLSLNWPSSYFVHQSIFIKWLFFSIVLSVFVDVLEFIIWW